MTEINEKSLEFWMKIIRYDMARGVKFCEVNTGRDLTDASEIAELLLNNPGNLMIRDIKGQEGHC